MKKTTKIVIVSLIAVIVTAAAIGASVVMRSRQNVSLNTEITEEYGHEDETTQGQTAPVPESESEIFITTKETAEATDAAQTAVTVPKTTKKVITTTAPSTTKVSTTTAPSTTKAPTTTVLTTTAPTTKPATTASYTLHAPTTSPTTAAKKPKQYSVKVSAGTGISSVIGGGSYKAGDTVTVGCSPMQNYSFLSWQASGVGTSTQQTYSFTMPAGDVSLRAEGVLKEYTVTVKAGAGIRAVNGGGVYKVGETVTVTQETDPNYNFRQWNSSSEGLLHGSSSGYYTFTMPAGNITLTAEAEAKSFTLTVQKGTGVSAVTGGGTYKMGASVTVNCTMQDGFSFLKWTSSSTGVLNGSQNQSYSFTMPNSNVTLTATGEKNKFHVTLSKGTGISSVTGAGSYKVGNTVTVSCTPSQGYKFTEWTSSNSSLVKSSSAQSFSFTMPKGNVSLTAKAVKDQYKVTLQKGTGISSVSGAGTYAVGDRVTINCTPSTGYAFVKWTSNNTSLISSSTSQSFSFNMPKGDITLTASAEKNEYTLSLTKGTGISSVSGAGKYKVGAGVTINCTPSAGYAFVKWTSNKTSLLSSSTSQSFSFNMPKGDITLTASAEKNEYTVSITKGTGISSVSGAGKYKVGDWVTVSASCSSSRYDFDRWKQNGSTVSYDSVYSFQMPSKDVSLRAEAVDIGDMEN